MTSIFLKISIGRISNVPQNLADHDTRVYVVLIYGDSKPRCSKIEVPSHFISVNLNFIHTYHAKTNTHQSYTHAQTNDRCVTFRAQEVLQGGVRFNDKLQWEIDPALDAQHLDLTLFNCKGSQPNRYSLPTPSSPASS